MKIIVDAMGGDFAPLAPVKGALMAQEKYGVDIVLTGKTEEILKALQQCSCKELPKGMEIANATEVVEICDDPATAFKHKKDSSLTVGLNMLHAGDADGFVSAGSTGALLAGATLVVKRIRGLRRAALAPTIPTAKGKAVLIDCGANAECRAEMLNAFGTMGSVYMNKVMGRKDPAVALVNNGAEDTKGTPMYREAHGLLKANPAIRFVGNIEPRDIMAGEVDVIVCDGFVGNVVLKLTEGVAGTLLGMLKDIFMQSIVTKLCYLGVKGGLRNLKHMMDSEEIGGAPLLGAAKPVIKAHGSSKAKGIKNAIRQAKLCVANDLCGTMQSALAEVAAKAAAEKTDAE